MAAAAEPPLDELLWTIAVARLIFGPEMNIQAPPNLTPGALQEVVHQLIFSFCILCLGYRSKAGTHEGILRQLPWWSLWVFHLGVSPIDICASTRVSNPIL